MMAALDRPTISPRAERSGRGPALPREGRSVPERSGEPWNYCGNCGRPMAWWQLTRKVHSRVTGQLVDVFVWECPSFLPHETGALRHDRMSRVVYDPTVPVVEAT
jgi:hypothetical protein